MNALSFILLIPAILMVLGVVNSTFNHEYDTSRILFQAPKLTIEDIGDMGGEVVSIQKDLAGNVVSIVSGKWQLNKSIDATTGGNNATIDFNSDLRVAKTDGIFIKKLKLTNFTLVRSNFTEKNVFFEGNASFGGRSDFKSKKLSTSNLTIPLNLTIFNKRVLSIASDSDLFQKYFEKSPVYAKVTYPKEGAVVTKKAPPKITSNVSTLFANGPVATDPKLKVELVTNKINFPTKMAFLNNNDLLVLEKNEGTVKRVLNGVVQNDSLLDVRVDNSAERGMLGIAIKKTNSTVHVFLYFTESVMGGDDINGKKMPLGNRLYRYDLENNTLINPKLLLDLPATPGPEHNGGDIRIDSQGNVYLTTGDLNRSNAKKSNSTMTKVQNDPNGLEPDGRAGILRVTEEGKPVGSGIIGNYHPLDKYFAYGIRNSFGMAFDPLTGKLWDVENGPDYGDEINLVEPGFNGGWNKTQGIWTPDENNPGNVTSSFSDLFSFNGTGSYSEPELSWYVPTPGLTSIIFLNSTKYGPTYANDMLVGDFHNGNIYNFKLNENRTGLALSAPLADKVVYTKNETDNVIFAKGFGAITDLEIGPDGYLYVLSLYQGGDNCDPIRHPNQPCVAYDRPVAGSIFRIVPISPVNE